MTFGKDFANPVVAVVEALASNERRRILIELEEKMRLSYSEILQRTGQSKGALNYHLKQLAAAGMIRNFIDGNMEPYSSYYEVSEFGRNLIENLLDSFRPPNRHIKYAMTCAASFGMQIYEQKGKESEEVRDAANASVPVIELLAR
jgi:DNA-binding transcriptional ArsR family regulator